jgi:hypothetical protein
MDKLTKASGVYSIVSGAAMAVLPIASKRRFPG